MSDNNKIDKDLIETPEDNNETITTNESVCVKQEETQSKPKGKFKAFFKKLFSKKNLKWTIPAIALIVAGITLATVFISIALNKPDEQTRTSDYITLNHYSVELERGQTVTLEVKKFSAEGKELSIEDLTFNSEAEKVVTVSEDGVLTGALSGQTYVQVKADGLKAACFVNVVEQNDKNDLEIKMVEACLYRGIPVNVYVYEYVNGVGSKIDADITWSVSDASVLSMKGNEVTALKTVDGASLKASLTYKGQEYNLEFPIKIEEPFVYLATTNDVKLADLKTYAGDDNTSFTSTSLKIIKRDVLDSTGASDTFVSASDLTPSSSNSAVVTAVIENDGIKINAKSLGQANVSVAINGTAVIIGARVTVVTPIASIKDMDALALASHADPNALTATASYMMVNDIDYNGQIVYPISATSTTTNNPKPTDAVGIQWKYLVEIDKYENEQPVYKFVDRTKVGTLKDGTNCYGLTDDEFVDFAKVGGLNPYNPGTAFSGKHVFKAAFDGNGFAIKNAKIMNAAYVSQIAYNNQTVYQGRATGVFGYVYGGTVKNVAFMNISMQSLDEFGPNANGTAADGKDLYRYYDMEEEKIVEKGEGLKVINTYTNCTVIRFAWNSANINNIYVEFDKSNFSQFTTRTGASGALVGWSQRSAVIQNCVVEIKNATYGGANSDYSIDTANEYTASDTTRRPYYYNTISIGVTTAFPAYKNKNFQDGNVWTNGSWGDLKNETVGTAANNELVKTLTQIVSSFSNKVWDFTEFNTNNGAPRLINGCSVNG